jgi:hypothetical protein
MSGFGEQRYGVKVDIEFAANLLIDEGLSKPKKQVLAEFGNLLTKINNAWSLKIQDYMNEVLRNLEIDIRYHKIQLRNIKVRMISEVNVYNR